MAPGDFGASPETAAGGQSEGSYREPLRPYQEFSARAGTVMELDPGFTVQTIGTGAPTAQEADIMAQLANFICASLRVSPATLLGNYKGISFSAGQLARQEERQGIEYLQMILTQQLYQPVFAAFLNARWVKMNAEFSELTPDDLPALLYPSVMLRRYEILDKAKTVGPILEAWNAGMMTFPEVRAELGMSGADVQSLIEEWKANRKALGLSETPAAGGAGGKEPPDRDAPAADDDDEGDDEEDKED